MSGSLLARHEAERGGRELPSCVVRLYGSLVGRTDGDVLSLSYLNDSQVLSVEEGGALRRWDLASGQQVESQVLSEMESCWAFSPDGTLLVSGSNTLALWNVETGNMLGRLGELPWVTTLAFSPDGKFIASGHDDRSVRLWNRKTGRSVCTLRGHDEEICALAFNADATRLASAGEDRLVNIWEVDSGKLLTRLEGHTDRIDALAWNPDGTTLASAGWDTSVRIWNGVSGELVTILRGKGEGVHCVLFSADGTQLITGDSDYVVRVWEYRTAKLQHELRGHKGAVRTAILHADGRHLVTAASDRAVQFWDLQTGIALETPSAAAANETAASGADAGAMTLEFPRTQVQSLSISKENRLISVHAEGRLCHWDTTSAELVPTLEENRVVVAAALGPKSTWAVGELDGSIRVGADAFSEKHLRWQAHETSVRQLVFSSDGQYLASAAGNDGSVKLWNTQDGSLGVLIPQATQNCTVEFVAFHPTEPLLAASGFDWLGSRQSEGCVVIWNTDTKQQEGLFEGGASRIAFSPDGALLAAVTTYDSIIIWEMATRQIATELTGLNLSAHAIGFHPSGHLFASGGDDCGLRLWQTSDWQLAVTFDLETRIKDLCFTPDGRGIVTGNANSTCYLVDLGNLSSPT